jgi:hypothetical protein
MRHREPPVGLPTHPRRAAKAGHPRLGDDCPDDPASPRPGSGSTPGRPHVDRVPPIAGLRHPSLRSLHRGDDPAEGALRPVLHRGSRRGECTCWARPPAPALRGSPSGPGTSPSRSGSPGSGSSCTIGDAKFSGPFDEVFPHGRGPSHPHPNPGAEGQHLRRAVHEDRPLGMPEPRPRLPTSASRWGAPCLREPSHGAAAASGAGPGHASRRLLVTGSADGTKADRSKGRPRRSHPRVRWAA